MRSLRVSRPGCARLLPLVALALAAGACAKETRFVAAEPNADADLRVVLASASTGQRAAAALGRDEPWTFALKDVFATEGATFRVYVYAFTLAQLAAEYPGLEGLSAAEVAALLAPAVGDPAEGAYAPPDPLRVLTAVIDPDSSGDVTYDEVSPSAARDDPNGRLVFHLPAAVACAPGERAFRLFNRVEPGRVCLYTRTAGCGWAPAGEACADLESIFERTFEAGAALREVPPKTITDGGDLTCAASSDLERGESRAWLCPGAAGATFVALQDAALAKDGSPWVPTLGNRPALGRQGQLARGPRGALFAADDGSGNLQLSRIQVQDSLQIDQLVYQSGNEPRTLSVSRAALGGLRRLTANAVVDSDEDQVVLDGPQGTVVLRGDHGLSTTLNRLAFYHPPVTIGADVLPLERRRGDVVSGPLDNVYALVDSGVVVLRAGLDAVTKVGETPAGRVSFDGSAALSFAAVKRASAERAVAWASDGRVWVFDPQGSLVVSDCQLDGELLAVIDGPRVVRRPQGARFVLELVDLAPAEGGGTSCREERLVTRYLVPASDQGAQGALAVSGAGHVSGGGRETLLYTYGAWAGVLDLGTGRSTAVELPFASATRSVLFEDYGGTALQAVLGTADDARYQALGLGELDDRIR